MARQGMANVKNENIDTLPPSELREKIICISMVRPLAKNEPSKQKTVLNENWGLICLADEIKSRDEAMSTTIPSH